MKGDKLWTTVVSREFLSDRIRVDSLNWNSEGILLRISDSSKIGLYDIKMLDVDDYYKLREELGYKEGERLGVYEWGGDGTTCGKMRGINVCNND